MLYQHLVQKQQLKIHPLQLQMLNLFHLNTIELEQRIQQELEENPIIEEKKEEVETTDSAEDPNAEYQDWDEYAYDDVPDYRVENTQYSQQADLPNKPIIETIDFRKEVSSQFSMLNLTEENGLLGEFIINSLSD